MDLRKSINFISDVVNNRPMPIRALDQIYMKHADMLLQIEHISKWLSEKTAIFIGDGDAIALCLVYLQKKEEIESDIKKILVLDFDERIVNSVNVFAQKHDLTGLIEAELYNVADPLPENCWHKFDCFYCNPPYGQSNDGRSITAFMQRGFEATNQNAIGCIVMADSPDRLWTRIVLREVQKEILGGGFVISEMIPRFHSYHLDDDPDLTSCSLIINRIGNENVSERYDSQPLSKEILDNFYGSHNPLKYKYIKDKTYCGKYPVEDYEIIPFDKEENES